MDKNIEKTTRTAKPCTIHISAFLQVLFFPAVFNNAEIARMDGSPLQYSGNIFLL
jgi:hypothetical protein